MRYIREEPSFQFSCIEKEDVKKISNRALNVFLEGEGIPVYNGLLNVSNLLSPLNSLLVILNSVDYLDKFLEDIESKMYLCNEETVINQERKIKGFRRYSEIFRNYINNNLLNYYEQEDIEAYNCFVEIIEEIGVFRSIFSILRPNNFLEEDSLTACLLKHITGDENILYLTTGNKLFDISIKRRNEPSLIVENQLLVLHSPQLRFLNEKITAEQIDNITQKFVVITRPSHINMENYINFETPLEIKGNKRLLKLKSFVSQIDHGRNMWEFETMDYHETGVFINSFGMNFVNDLYKYVINIKDNTLTCNRIFGFATVLIYENISI